jgi:ribosomal 50S subunit-associated protein YjgA (DUF615 family)
MESDEIDIFDRERVFRQLEENDNQALSVIDSKLKQKLLWLDSKTTLKFIKAILEEANANTRFTFALYYSLENVRNHLILLTDEVLKLMDKYEGNFDFQEIKKQIQGLKQQVQDNQDIVDLFKAVFDKRYFGQE